MSKYNEFSAELEKHINELTILNTKVKNCSGLGKEDTHSLLLLHDIIKTYNYLKTYPTAKLQEFSNNNTHNATADNIPNLSQILENNCDNEQDARIQNNNKSIFNFENSDDELDNITDDDEFEIDDGNNQETRDAYEQYQRASMLRLKHVRNTKWYSVQTDGSDDDESDDDDDSSEGYESSDSIHNNDESNSSVPVQPVPSAPPAYMPPVPPTSLAPPPYMPPTPHTFDDLQTLSTPKNNSNINSFTTYHNQNEFKEVFGQKTEVYKPLCHMPSLELMYAV